MKKKLATGTSGTSTWSPLPLPEPVTCTDLKYYWKEHIHLLEHNRWVEKAVKQVDVLGEK